MTLTTNGMLDVSTNEWAELRVITESLHRVPLVQLRLFSLLTVAFQQPYDKGAISWRTPGGIDLVTGSERSNDLRRE